MENYALMARQEKQIEALKTENDYLKKVKSPTQIENANLRQRNDTLEIENNSLQSEIQVMTEKHNLLILEPGSDFEVAEYALIARQEKQIEALKTENDHLKKVKNPTEIENANLRQRNDILELENNSLQSEIQVLIWEHETVKRDAESAKSQELEFTRQHNKEKKKFLLIMAFTFVVVVLLASIVTYNFGYRNALNGSYNFQFGQVMTYLVVHQKSGELIHPNTVSVNTGVRNDVVLSILLKLEKGGILTKSQFPGVESPSLFQLE